MNATAAFCTAFLAANIRLIARNSSRLAVHAVRDNRHAFVRRSVLEK